MQLHSSVGEEVGDGQLFEAADPARQHREQGLACAVCGGAGGKRGRRRDDPAPPFAGDDPHARSLSGTGPNGKGRPSPSRAGWLST